MGPVPALGAKSGEDPTTILNRALDADLERNTRTNGPLTNGSIWQAYHPELPVHWRHSDGTYFEYYLPRQHLNDRECAASHGKKVKPIKRQQMDPQDNPNSWCPNLTVEEGDKFPKLHHWYVARSLSPKQHVLMVTTSNTQRNKSRLHVPAGKIDGIRDTFIYRASVWTTTSDVNEPGWRFIRSIGRPILPIPSNLPLQSLLTCADESDYLHSASDLRAKVDSSREKPFRLWEIVKVRGDGPEQQFDGIIVGDLAITGLQRSGALHANQSADAYALGSVIVLRLVKHQQGDGAQGRFRYVPLPILAGQSTQYSVDTALFRTAPCKYVHNKSKRISLDEMQAQQEDRERGIAAAKGGAALVTDIRYLIQEFFNAPPDPTQSSQSPPSESSGGASRGESQSGAAMTTPKDKDEERRQWARAAWQEPVSEETIQRSLEAQREDAWLFPLAVKELGQETPNAPGQVQLLIEAWRTATSERLAQALESTAIKSMVDNLVTAATWAFPNTGMRMTASSQWAKPAPEVRGDFKLAPSWNKERLIVDVTSLRGLPVDMCLAVTTKDGSVLLAAALPCQKEFRVVFERDESAGFEPAARPWNLVLFKRREVGART